MLDKFPDLDSVEWGIIKAALSNKNRAHVTRHPSGAAKLSRKAKLSKNKNELVLTHSIFRLPIPGQKVNSRTPYFYLSQASKAGPKPLYGGTSRFKIALSEQGILYGVKRYHKNIRPNDQAIYQLMEDERQQLDIAGYEAHAFFGKNQKGEMKFYLITRYLGQDLLDYCAQYPLWFSEKLLIAARISLQVAKLHAGILSNQKMPLIHYDIKPENITVDSHFTPQLIDFGFADQPQRHNAGKTNRTTTYRPLNENQCSAYALDVFALKRTFFKPKFDMIDSSIGRIARDDIYCLFDDDEIQRYPELANLIDTHDNCAYEDSAIFLAARFSTWLFNENVPAMLLYINPWLCWQLAGRLEGSIPAGPISLIPRTANQPNYQGIPTLPSC